MARIEAINCALARIGTFSIESRHKVVSTCVRWTVLSLIGWQPIKVSLTGWRWYFQTSLSGGDFNHIFWVNSSGIFLIQFVSLAVLRVAHCPKGSS